MVFPPPGWVEAMSAAASGVDVAPDVSITIRIEVDGPDRWVHRVLVGDGRVTVEPGDGPADVILRTDETTALALVSGRVSTEAAVVAGQLRIGGDFTALARAHAALAAVGDVFAGARTAAVAHTSKDPPARQ